MARTWQEHGKSMARAWQEHGKNMARAWQEHGKTEHDKNMASAWQEYAAEKTNILFEKDCLREAPNQMLNFEMPVRSAEIFFKF